MVTVPATAEKIQSETMVLDSLRAERIHVRYMYLPHHTVKVVEGVDLVLLAHGR